MSTTAAVVFDSDSSPRQGLGPWHDHQFFPLLFERTPAGRSELEQPSLGLSVRCHDLLQRVDRAWSAAESVQTGDTATQIDVMFLLRRGLLRCVAAHADTAPLRQAFEAILLMSTEEIYLLLTQQAKLRLSLIGAFRLILSLERCNSDAEQLSIAFRFINDVWRLRGPAGLTAFEGALASSLRSNSPLA